MRTGSRYAEGTSVPAERSQAEIRSMILRFGAQNYGYSEGRLEAQVVFEHKGARVLFRLPMPSPKDVEARRHSKRGVEEAVAQETRRRWRALCLVIKAKLESVAGEIETFEEAFLAHVVLPTGETVGDYVVPRVAELWKGSKVPLLPVSSEPRP